MMDAIRRVRGTTFLLFVFAVHHSLVVAQTSANALPSLDDQTAAVESRDRPIGIVIMAQGRSGSTMLGETFRQNKDVLYWYEPCRSWGQGLFDSSSQYHREVHGEECSDLVRRLARCEFTLQDSARLGVDPGALESGSRGLEPLRAASANPSADALERAHASVVVKCMKSKGVVVKTIRADAGVGGPDGDASGILVIHLVRDPRAVIHSQIKTFNVAHKYRRYFSAPSEVHASDENKSPDSKNATQAGAGSEAESGTGYLPWWGQARARALGTIICGVYKEQLDSSAKLGASRYLRVRYEDMASSAESTIARIYRWSGLGPVPPRVSIWVNENTRLPDCVNPPAVAAADTASAIVAAATLVPAAEEKTRRGLSDETSDERNGRSTGSVSRTNCREETAKQAAWDRYGTRRHAAAMVGLWRTQMPEDEAAVVWESCTESGVMEALEYSP